MLSALKDFISSKIYHSKVGDGWGKHLSFVKWEEGNYKGGREWEGTRMTLGSSICGIWGPAIDKISHTTWKVLCMECLPPPFIHYTHAHTHQTLPKTLWYAFTLTNTLAHTHIHSQAHIDTQLTHTLTHTIHLQTLLHGNISSHPHTLTLTSTLTCILTHIAEIGGRPRGVFYLL